jgi:soluble lytic murein transglycosylase-like protein
MRVLRSLTLLVLLSTVAFGVAIADSAAQAQTADESEQEAETAERQAEVAAGLVDTAVARRADIEAELAVSITRISDLSAELSAVSSDLDRLKAQIAYGDAELTGIEADIEVHAIDAYMDALVGPGVSFVNSANVEQAMVTGQVVGDVVTAGAARVNELVVRRDALEGLQVQYREQQERVAELKAEVDAEVEHLAALYDEADVAVGRAVREASAADAAYRDALSAVDAAQAREEERRRQEERAPATTTPAPPGEEEDAPSTTTPPLATPETTDGGGGGGGNWDFPPAVERWRSLVQAYFPASRVDEALAVLQCESLGDADAYNPYSGASGLYQFLPSTWASASSSAGFSGASAFDGEANIGTAAWLAKEYEELGKGFWGPWSCRRVLG